MLLLLLLSTTSPANNADTKVVGEPGQDLNYGGLGCVMEGDSMTLQCG